MFHHRLEKKKNIFTLISIQSFSLSMTHFPTYIFYTSSHWPFLLVNNPLRKSYHFEMDHDIFDPVLYKHNIWLIELNSNDWISFKLFFKFFTGQRIKCQDNKWSIKYQISHCFLFSSMFDNCHSLLLRTNYSNIQINNTEFSPPIKFFPMTSISNQCTIC